MSGATTSTRRGFCGKGERIMDTVVHTKICSTRGSLFARRSFEVENNDAYKSVFHTKRIRACPARKNLGSGARSGRNRKGFDGVLTSIRNTTDCATHRANYIVSRVYYRGAAWAARGRGWQRVGSHCGLVYNWRICKHISPASSQARL